MTHTPTPWTINEFHGVQKDGSHISDVQIIVEGFSLGSHSVGGRANTEFIVRAVNAHDALVEALETLLRFVPDRPTQFYEERINRAKAALKLAKGET